MAFVASSAALAGRGEGVPLERRKPLHAVHAPASRPCPDLPPALRGLPETMDGQPPLPVPDLCPVTLEELLSDE